jgi:hypothetical protein
LTTFHGLKRLVLTKRVIVTPLAEARGPDRLDITLKVLTLWRNGLELAPINARI